MVITRAFVPGRRDSASANSARVWVRTGRWVMFLFLQLRPAGA